MNESETRAEAITPPLRRRGWGVAPGRGIREVYQIAPGRIDGSLVRVEIRGER